MTPTTPAQLVPSTADPVVFTPSPQQAALFHWIDHGRGSALVEAVAGAGKTTTLVKSMELMEGTVLALMYGNAAQRDFKEKAEAAGVLSKYRHVSTCHSAGLYDWRNVCPKNRKGESLLEITDAKTKRIIDDLAKQDPTILGYRSFVTKMVSFGKQFLMGVADPYNSELTRKRAISNMGVWRGLANHFGADQDLTEDMDINLALADVVKVFNISREMCKMVIDFDDMIYAPIAHNVRMFGNDWVLVDECQDINPARREIAKRLLKPGGRLIAVGDSRQAIFGFTGAGADSLERIATEFKCKRLPLTITYRCPKAVVAYVHQWVDHIEAHESAPEGIVRTYVQPPAVEGEKELPWHEHEKVRAGDAVLCRYTVPLIKAAYSMLRHGRACKVEGREIGNGLVQLATKWKVKSLDALDTKLEKYLTRETEKALAQDNETKAEEIADKVESLQVFIGRCRGKQLYTIEALVAEIESLFADDVKGVAVLATGHKSKGREWNRVLWIQAAQRRRNLKPWEEIQEINLKYVIGTRSKHELVLIPENV
jgi:DNA helicase-2/ATP-dependent DNA helicase PcrA